MYSKKTKTLTLVGPVNDEMFKVLVRAVEVTPSTIILNTGGGCIYTALAMYDIIRSEMPKVQIITAGQCMSAGMIILQAGYKRFAYENTQLMVHYGEEGNNSMATVKHNSILTDTHAKIIAKRSLVTEKKIKSNWFWKDTFLTTEQALNYGLIDYILEVQE